MEDGDIEIPREDGRGTIYAHPEVIASLKAKALKLGIPVCQYVDELIDRNKD
jgi:hypothetical protein